MKLKGDKVLRDRFFTPESYQHPAKGHLGLWWEILERYTKPGEWVLDPMAGVGATMMGALMGRNIICVEMEQRFVEQMRASWEKMRQNPMLGHDLGQVLILRGDARALPLGRVDAAVLSPPYEESVHGGHGLSVQGFHDPQRVGRNSQSLQEGYTRPVDAAIFSPPYEQEHQGGLDARPEAQQGSMAGRTAERYTRPVDAAIFSPPYGEALTGGGIAQEGFTKDYQPDKISGGNLNPVGKRTYMAENHNHSPENIGNLRGPAYWDAMQQVYAEWHRVLKPGGLMVLVLKGFTRDGQYVDLPAQTRTLCETLGFSFVETWQRELWALSFWRILQGSEKKAVKLGLQMGLTQEDITEVIRTYRVSNGKLDDRLRFETVLVSKKEHTEC